MSIAWTTILIIALLLPGVFFFIGYATRERYTREIVKSSAIGDIGWAIFIAITIHLLAWGVLSFFGFDLAANIKQVADYESMFRWQIVDHAVRRIAPVAIYVLATAIVGLLFGFAFGSVVAEGWLPFFATHKWINEVMRSMRSSLVTAYVMTTTKENKRVLMYKGVLAEFYLSPEGKFIYVVLKTCSRYYMKFEEDAPTTSVQLQLFGSQGDSSDRSWDYLLIDGANIANILFDPSPEIVATKQGQKSLDEELADFLLRLQREGLTHDQTPGTPPGTAPQSN